MEITKVISFYLNHHRFVVAPQKSQSHNDEGEL
jgi:hypothetical protein